jgi:uncharacterized protein YcbX
MTTVPYLAGIFIYPIKSLDRIALTQATVLQSGALQHDREFAVFDQQGRFVNGKRNAKVHRLRSAFDAQFQRLCLQIQGTDQRVVFHIDEERTALETWLSDYFGFPVKFVQNVTGFPDDTNAPGPTVISTGTIEEVASWFPEVSVEEMRLRLRANLEIGGVPPFWEDQLFAQAGQCVQFQVGEVLFEGINPCQRCVVPTRDSMTGEMTANFQKIFVTRRKESLPSWVNKSRFNHFFRLSVNTRVPESEAGKVLQIKDAIKVAFVTNYLR